MTAKSMPSHAWILGPQGCQGRTSETAALVSRLGVWLLHPSKEASAADLIVDRKDLLAVQVRRALAPLSTFGRYRILPGFAQPRNNGPAMPSAKPPSRYPLQRSPHRFPAGGARDMACRLPCKGPSPRGMAIFAI